MGKLLVVPHPAYLNAAAALSPTSDPSRGLAAAILASGNGDTVGHSMATAEAGHAAGGAANASPGLQSVLQRRREGLALFAASVTTATSKGLATLKASRTAGMAGASDTTVRRARAAVKTLPSLGALVIDEALVDLRALEWGLGAKVFKNVLIPIVRPRFDVRMTDDGVQSIRKVAAAAADTWHLSSINVNAARAKNLDGSGVLVGVLDTGIDPTHPELRDALLQSHVGSYAEFDMDGNAIHSAAHDPERHGTHVCGLIAGRNSGVAPAAKLAVASVLTYPTWYGMAGYLVQIAAGLDWLLSASFRGASVDPGVDVVNASLGGSSYDSYLYQMLADARLTTGTVMVAAIGNEGEQGVGHHGSPGNYDLAIGVGAMDVANSVCDFSSWGAIQEHGGLAKPDLVAPGGEIWSSIPGGGYEAMSGTSMASPIVAGAAALLIQRTPDYGSDGDELRKELFRLTSTPPVGLRAGRGRLDLSNI